MSGWIADHMENVSLHGIKSNPCPKCAVPPEDLGSQAGHHCARDYARYEPYERENPSLDSEPTTLLTLATRMKLIVSKGAKRFSRTRESFDA